MPESSAARSAGNGPKPRTVGLWRQVLARWSTSRRLSPVRKLRPPTDIYSLLTLSLSNCSQSCRGTKTAWCGRWLTTSPGSLRLQGPHSYCQRCRCLGIPDTSVNATQPLTTQSKHFACCREVWLRRRQYQRTMVEESLLL